MAYIMGFNKRNVFLSLIAVSLLYILFKLLIFRTGFAFFDEGVYISMANYFISFGEYGYFEPIRPLLLSFILSPFQLMDIDPLLSGRIVSVLLVIACIPIIYWSSESFKKGSGIIASLIFMTSTNVLLFSGYVLVDAISYVLAFFSLALAMKRKYILSGIIFGIAFLFKFPIIIILPILGICILMNEKKKFIFPSIYLFCTALLVSSPYFIFNYFHYSNLPIMDRLLDPLTSASSLVQNETYLYETPSIAKYLLNFAVFELIIVLGIAFFIYYSLKRKKIDSINKDYLILYALSCILFVSYFSFALTRYDQRYILSIIPFGAVIASVGFMAFIKHHGKKYSYLVIALILAQGLIATAIFSFGNVKDDEYMHDLLQSHEGKIVTNDGFALIYIKDKASLMPGQNLGDTFSRFMLDNESSLLVLSIDGYPCHPKLIGCQKEIDGKISRIIHNNNLIACGYVHGARTLVISKDHSSISSHDCTDLLGLKDDVPIKPQPFIRISEVSIDDQGNMNNKERLLNLSKKLSNLGLPYKIIFSTSNLPNEESATILNNLSDAEFGIVLSSCSSSFDFIIPFEEKTKRKISIVNPAGDDWMKKKKSIPYGISSCLVGSWDQSIMPVPCSKMDLYLVDDWSKYSIYDLSYLESKYDILYNSDIEIGIDIPSGALNGLNYNNIDKFIDYVSGKGRTDD